MPIQIIAHRGHSTAAPENTLAAFRKALEVQSDGVEFDVHLSQDGVPVVIHDETLERTTTGTGDVGAQSLEALQALDAGRWFGDEFAGETLPTLDALFLLLRASPVTLHLELKTRHRPYPGLVGKVVDQIGQAGLASRVVISSFNHDSLREVHRLAPGLATAALFSARSGPDWRPLLDGGFAGLHPPYQLCDETLVQACRAHHLAVRPWTVDDETEAERLLRLGVDGIITNRPDTLLALRQRLQGRG